MKKIIGLIIMLLITLISFSGCAKVNYEVEINKDGSGKITYIYGISKEKLGNSKDLVEQFVETMKEQAEENDYTVEIYEDEKNSGFIANKHLENLSEEFSLEEAFGEEYVKDTDNNKINIEKSLWKTKYSQNAELDLTNLKDTNIEMSYKIKLPTKTKTKTNNATEVSEDGKALTWNLKSGEINRVEFIAEEINAMAIVIVVGVLIAAVTVTVILILKKKYVTKKEN